MEILNDFLKEKGLKWQRKRRPMLTDKKYYEKMKMAYDISNKNTEWEKLVWEFQTNLFSRRGSITVQDYQKCLKAFDLEKEWNEKWVWEQLDITLDDQSYGNVKYYAAFKLSLTKPEFIESLEAEGVVPGAEYQMKKLFSEKASYEYYKKYMESKFEEAKQNLLKKNEYAEFQNQLWDCVEKEYKLIVGVE